MYIEQLPSGHFRYQMTFTEERTGKRKRVSCTLPKNTEKAQREAREILARKIAEVNANYEDAPLTLSEAFTAYLEANAGIWRSSTLRRNSRASRALIRDLGSDTLIGKLTARYVLSHITGNNTTKNENMVRLKAFLRWCYDTDRIEDITWIQKLKPFPEPSKKAKNREKYLEKDELLKLLPELKVDIDRYVIAFLALSGLRIGETLCLTKDDVDLSERVIHVTKTVDHATGEVQEGAKTLTSMRDVYIQDELLELCKDIRKYMTEMSLRCGFRTELFFSDFDGKPLQYWRVNKYFAENCERVIGRRLSLHSLRHTHASLMFEGGSTLEAVSLRLGHSDSRVTKEIYLHITERLKEKYNQTFDRIRILS